MKIHQRTQFVRLFAGNGRWGTGDVIRGCPVRFRLVFEWWCDSSRLLEGDGDGFRVSLT